MRQQSLASTNIAVTSVRLVINSLFLCRLVTIPVGRRLIKDRDSIMSKIESTSPFLLSLTAILPQSVLCLLKSPAIISLIDENLLWARVMISKMY